jgi:hypothetical protein
VKLITLEPKSARKHYNIQIPAQQQFVMVENIATIPPESEKQCYQSTGYGAFKREDLIDAIIIPGEVPQHGQIRTVAEFERLAAACTPGCLIFARHKNYGKMSDIIQQGELHPRLFSRDGVHACDTSSKYIYNIHFDPAPGHETENWLPPREYAFYCASHAPPPGSQPVIATTAAFDSAEQEIESIRNGPHEPMPAAQATTMSSLGGQTSMEITNSTDYALYFYVAGPISQSIQLAPHTSQSLSVAPGSYTIAAKVSDAAVIPFYGTEHCVPNTQYSHNFYISTQPR